MKADKKFILEAVKQVIAEAAKIKLCSRLNLSSKDRVELLEVGNKSLLIVFSKNAQPNVFELSSCDISIEESAQS